MPVVQKLYRSGNSTVLTIPKDVQATLKLFPGQIVELQATANGNLLIVPVYLRPKARRENDDQ